MMRSLKTLTAQNETITVQVPPDRLAVAGVQYPTGGAGAVSLEGTIDGITWELIQVRKSTDETALATSIIAAGMHYADVSYCHSVRVRKTDAGSTGSPVGLILNHN